MSDDPCIFKLDEETQLYFAGEDEVFPNLQLGQAGSDFYPVYYLIIGGRVAVLPQAGLEVELDRFYAATWTRYRNGQLDIVGLYEDWLKNLPDLKHKITCRSVARSILQSFAATGSVPPNPPPPPSRPSIIPGGARPPGTSVVHGHLPFQDVTTAQDIYYRFEPYPSSKRIVVGQSGTFTCGTYASPQSELPFLPTGFAAVARNALPLFFPAVFRYELAPVPNASILCGAIVPMNGQSGGGVEVMFTSHPTTANRGAIANPALVYPL